MANNLTPNVGEDAYNSFSEFAGLSYRCIQHLINNNEAIWKLLKYSDSDAWSKSDLTIEQKGELIYSGQEDASQYHVFMDSEQPDVMTEETTVLRIMPYYAVGVNRTTGYIEVSMEVYSHYKINHLSNYKTRVDSIAGELLGEFNGVVLKDSLGLMAFSKMKDESSRLFEVGQIPFGGKQLIFSIFSAN